MRRSFAFNRPGHPRQLGVVDGSSLKSLALQHSPKFPISISQSPHTIVSPQGRFASSFSTPTAIGCGHDLPSRLPLPFFPTPAQSVVAAAEQQQPQLRPLRNKPRPASLTRTYDNIWMPGWAARARSTPPVAPPLAPSRPTSITIPTLLPPATPSLLLWPANPIWCLHCACLAVWAPWTFKPV